MTMLSNHYRDVPAGLDTFVSLNVLIVPYPPT
jgi:hypothetical protein